MMHGIIQYKVLLRKYYRVEFNIKAIAYLVHKIKSIGLVLFVRTYLSLRYGNSCKKLSRTGLIFNYMIKFQFLNEFITMHIHDMYEPYVFLDWCVWYHSIIFLYRRNHYAFLYFAIFLRMSVTIEVKFKFLNNHWELHLILVSKC